jgi:HrpA-like RNA helicase
LTDCLAVRLRTDEFFQIFNKNQMTVMVGETGSGKTTQ